MLRNKKKAFTITELVIVIAVIAILAAVLIPTFSNVIASAKQSKAMQQSRNALTSYINDNPEADIAGMVFVADNHAFVYLNGALQYIGIIAYEGTDTKQSSNIVTVSKSGATTETFENITITNGATGDATKFSVTLGSNAAKGYTFANNGSRLFVYSVSVNGTLYEGFFTLNESGKSNTHQAEGAYYSVLAACPTSGTAITIALS